MHLVDVCRATLFVGFQIHAMCNCHLAHFAQLGNSLKFFNRRSHREHIAILTIHLHAHRLKFSQRRRIPAVDANKSLHSEFVVNHSHRHYAACSARASAIDAQRAFLASTFSSRLQSASCSAYSSLSGIHITQKSLCYVRQSPFSNYHRHRHKGKRCRNYYSF